jgi:catechol 2,3-dioxygenase-like lactoylglutathione lyase family enzyme
MSDLPKIARALNHVAYPTTDTGATYRFYTEILGFTLVAAVRGDKDPESNSSKPHLHTFFSMRSGEVIAFFDIEGLEKPKRDHFPTWVRHFAMSVDSYEDLMAWRQRLLDHGVKVSPVVDHGGVWFSIYFPDPNDVLLELTYQARPLNADDAAQAARMVGEWTAAHGQKMALH